MFSNCYKQRLHLKVTINYQGSHGMILTIKAVSIAVLILLSNASFANPGRTASDGCHYCRTNCSEWGVPWNVRHCHNSQLEEFERLNNLGLQRNTSRLSNQSGKAFGNVICLLAGGTEESCRSEED